MHGQVSIMDKTKVGAEFQNPGKQLPENRRLIEDLQEAKRQTMAKQRALLEKTGEGERANEIKTDLLANMSHELRTPLNVIIGFSQLLMDEVPGKLNDEQRWYISEVLESSQQMLSLINDTLGLSRVDRVLYRTGEKRTARRRRWCGG
jgi:signal transduction histidine kinase